MMQSPAHVAIVEHPLDAQALMARVQAPSVGAIDLFVGVVRDNNLERAVTGIEYSAYREMAEKEIRAIASEAQVRFGGVSLAVEHRVGVLTVGEPSVIIAGAHAHRAPAMDAVRFVIEELKKRAPIWKREHYVDGTRDWVHAGSGMASEVRA